MRRWPRGEDGKIANHVLPGWEACVARLIARPSLECSADEAHAVCSTAPIVRTTRRCRKSIRVSPRGSGMFRLVPMGYGHGIASNLEGYRSWSSFLLERTR